MTANGIRFTPAQPDCPACAAEAMTAAGLDVTQPFVVLSAAGDTLDADLVRDLVANTVGSKIFIMVSTPLAAKHTDDGEEEEDEGFDVSQDELGESDLRAILGVEEGERAAD